MRGILWSTIALGSLLLISTLSEWSDCREYKVSVEVEPRAVTSMNSPHDVGAEAKTRRCALWTNRRRHFIFQAAVSPIGRGVGVEWVA